MLAASGQGLEEYKTESQEILREKWLRQVSDEALLVGIEIKWLVTEILRKTLWAEGSGGINDDSSLTQAERPSRFVLFAFPTKLRLYCNVEI